MATDSSDIKFMNFLQNETFINIGNDDIEVIQKVFGHFRDTVLILDFTEISEWIKRFHLHLLEIQDVVDMDPKVSIRDVALCFKHFGCPELGDSILLEKSFHSVVRGPPRKQIENDHMYKRVFDLIRERDVCKVKNVVSFINQHIYTLDRRMSELSGTKSCQKLVDKTVALVFALLHGVYCLYQQNDILGKLSSVIPADVDKTFFNCLYFSKKALNASFLEDDESEALYRHRAEVELQVVSPCFVVGLARWYLALAEEKMFEKTGLQFHARCAALNKAAYLDCLPK